MNPSFKNSPAVLELLNMHISRWEELPTIDLYMDQLLSYINEKMQPFTDPSELNLTKSMVNNYVKQKIIPAPVNKKYQRQHLALLMLIYGLKKSFSIPECVEIIRFVSPSGVLRPKDYDACCLAMEVAIRNSFGDGEATLPEEVPPMLYRAVLACADKLYLQKYMDFSTNRQL